MAAEEDSSAAAEENTIRLQLTLVRHGETEANRKQILQGQLDTPLSEYGCQQSRLVGERLAKAETISHIYCSDLSRTVQTAELIVEELGYTVKITQDARLRERAYGSHEGRPIVDLIQAARERGVSVKNYTVSVGESLEAVNSRVSEFLSEILSTLSTNDVLKMNQLTRTRKRGGGGLIVDPSLPLPDSHTLIVSHGGTLYSAFEYVRELGVSDMSPWSASHTTPNAAISSFMLNFRRGHCEGGHLLLAHSTQHLTRTV